MTRTDSLRLTAQLGAFIAERAPAVDWTQAELEEARRTLGGEGVAALARAGYIAQDFETYYVLEKFLAMLELPPAAEGAFTRALFAAARKFTPQELRQDPYLCAVRAPTVRLGRFLLTEASYARGELFVRDVPDFGADPVVPQLGFCTDAVRFPSIYEDEMPWMSVCPSEMATMRAPLARAHGRMLVLGLGLGYYPFLASRRPEVVSIDIVERSEEVIRLFTEHLLPQFPLREKLRVLHADAFEYLAALRGGEYDFCFADIWENHIDGAASYRKLRPHAARLRGTEFAYWIEDAIRWQLGQESV